MARRDWKRQFLRIRQIADQNLGRVEKTEALTADLQTLEKRVEQYGKVFAGTSKKLISCLQTQPGQDREKRQKKLPEHALSCQLLDSSNQLGLDTLVGQIFQMCGDAEAHVAKRTLDLECEIEEQVLAPICKLVENDIPAILKHKKNLQKLVLDMDSAKTRYTSAMKEQSKANMNNPQSSTTKVDNLREEFDEACNKVDLCRDQLATEMFTLASRESELSSILLELIKCQAKYHKEVLDDLEKRIPQMEEQMQFYQHVPVFGKPIEDHLERSNRTIALVIEECVKNLITLGGLEEEGLFRIAGTANKIKKLKAAFDSEQIAEIAEEYDVHVIAGVLKLYLRELPDPLMKSSLYPDWMKAAHAPSEERLQALADVLAKLPKHNSENLKFLIKFLHKVSEFQEVNRMSPSNLSIVMGPNLIWAQGENGPSVLTTSAQSAIVEALISHCDYFFPGDEDIFEQIFTNLENSSLEPAQHDPLTSLGSGESSGQMASAGQTEYKQPSPEVVLHGGAAQALVSSVHGSATAPFGSQENVSSSSSSSTSANLSVLDNLNGSKAPSPKPPRRMNKKPAPLPPGERPHCPAPPPPSGLSAYTAVATAASTATAAEMPTAAGASNLPYPVKPPLPYKMSEQHTAARTESAPEQQAMTKPLEQQQQQQQQQPPVRPEKPPEPQHHQQQQQQQQQSSKHQEKSADQQAEYQVSAQRPDRPADHQSTARPERPPEYQAAVRPDRPSSPTKTRPLGLPPEKPQPSEKPEKPARPEKPEKPTGTSVEKLYPSLSPTVAALPPTQPKEHSPPQRPKAVLNAPSSDVAERPPVPPPPGVKPDAGAGHGHRRQSSGSGRPPRPQPPPPPPPSKPTSVSQTADSSDKAAAAPSSDAASDDQTPPAASRKLGEDTYL